MSIKRILGITIFGVLFIAAVISIMLLTSHPMRDNDVITLPDPPASSDSAAETQPTGEAQPDKLSRVEVTRDNIQANVSILSRPEVYSRDVVIETFWESGYATYLVSVTVADGVTSLQIQPPAGSEKRIIITADTLYIWYQGDGTPYIGDIGSVGDGYRSADEWQMLVTYEELLDIPAKDIIDAGYTEFNGIDCIFAEYLSPLLGYTRKYYVSIENGLIAGAVDYDKTGSLVYTMIAGECMVGEADPTAFILPNGTYVGGAS